MTLQKLQELITKFDSSPYALLLGMKVVELAEGHARIAVSLSPQHNSWMGRTHGGLIMSLADQAFGCATNSLNIDRTLVAAQFDIYLVTAPDQGETLYADARVVHNGRSYGVVEIRVEDSKGKVIARAMGSVVALNKGQPEREDTWQSTLR